MKSSVQRNKEQKKKPYIKPEVKQVPLRPEEAVLASCKTQNTIGPSTLGFHCNHGGSPCSDLTS